MVAAEEKILFVLVIYGCRVEDSLSYKTLIQGSEEINLFVYDNSPILQCTNLQVAEYVHDTSNGGLGKAYNAACRYAFANGYKWLLLLDQDTIFPKEALLAYRRALALNLGVDMIVPRLQVEDGRYMSPTHYFMKTSKLQREVPVGRVRLTDVSPVNSGMLVTVDSFRRVGGYEDDVWLDFSDICFIEKYKRKYSDFYILPDVVCTQAFSGLECDKEKIYKRFCIYLECARNFPRKSFIDSVELFLTTLRPTLSRTIKERTLRYLKAYVLIYLNRG